MPKSGGVDVEEDRAFAELAGHSWSWYFMDPSKLHTCMNVAAFVEVARAPGVNRRRSAHKTATHISVDLVIVLFRVDVTCHTSRVTVMRHNVCCI